MISTGNPHLDAALGGGIPNGAVVEIFGDPGTGKTTLAMDVVADAQRQGLTCAWLDTDRTFSGPWAQGRGVVIERLLFGSTTDIVERATAICMRLVASGAIGLFVLDNVASMPMRAEVDGDCQDDDENAMDRARFLAAVMTRLVPLARANDATVLLINHSGPDADPLATPGGRAIREKSVVRIHLHEQGQFSVVKNARHNAPQPTTAP